MIEHLNNINEYTEDNYKIAETVGITGGWPVTVEPVYGYFEHSSGLPVMTKPSTETVPNVSSFENASSV